MNRFENKVVVITGAGQGVGCTAAKMFAAEGASVIVTGRTLSKLENTVKEIGADKAFAFRMDVGEEQDWIDLVAFAKEKFGRIDVLVNNAAIVLGKDILTMSFDEFKMTEHCNLDSIFLSMKYCYEIMTKNGGSIVNISSVGGLKAGPDTGNDAAYNATKAGERNLTKHAAFVFAKDGIRVNSVHPAGIRTEMMKNHLEMYPELINTLAINNPLPPHVSEPEDIANAIMFLASDQARTITGTELIVDCGMMAI